MPSYRYTGPDERIPAPPLQGDLIPGELVRSEEPVDHPDPKLADENDLPDAEVKAMHDEGEPVDLAAEATPRPRARARAKE